MISYPIVEIFHSVQGEGYHSGESSIFVRFGRCNLRCEWCDTDFDIFDEMSIQQIVEKISEFNCKKIIFTGGEPALQNLEPLINKLRPHGYIFSIETNGTVELPEGLIDWICVSPKDQMYPNVSIKQRFGDELKCVYVGQDLSIYDELKEGFNHLYLQPCYDESKDVMWNGVSFRQTVEVVKENPEWNLSLQTHKWMGVD
jgi:7-carboxy-7-deazaguanine synthase|tara:strand:- start:64 stop:663 length:600 start_codon:yes stop_codon:yes gene_type:complete